MGSLRGAGSHTFVPGVGTASYQILTGASINPARVLRNDKIGPAIATQVVSWTTTQPALVAL